jgi:hypothetical protein
MFADSPSALPAEPRLSTRLRRAKWIGAAAGALLIGAFGIQLALPIYHQHAALRELKTMQVSYEIRPVGSHRLRRSIGEQRMALFDRIVAIHAGGSEITDASLRYFRGLADLRYLDLHETPITDSGLKHLRDLAKLDDLRLEGTQITDSGLAALHCLPLLQILDLSNMPNITDAGLVHLTSLTKLQRLALVRTRITDAGLEHLALLKQHCRLDLRDTRVTGAGVERLRNNNPNLAVWWSPPTLQEIPPRDPFGVLTERAK